MAHVDCNCLFVCSGRVALRDIAVERLMHYTLTTITHVAFHYIDFKSLLNYLPSIALTGASTPRLSANPRKSNLIDHISEMQYASAC